MPKIITNHTYSVTFESRYDTCTVSTRIIGVENIHKTEVRDAVHRAFDALPHCMDDNHWYFYMHRHDEGHNNPVQIEAMKPIEVIANCEACCKQFFKNDKVGEQYIKEHGSKQDLLRFLIRTVIGYDQEELNQSTNKE